LFAFLLLRALPQVLFLTRTGARLEAYGGLAAMRRASSSDLDEAWSALDVGAGFEAVVEALADAQVELPEVGLDLPDPRGLSSGIEGELVWESLRTAVVREIPNGARSRVAADWRVFELGQCVADITPLISALRGAAQGAPT
jgi:hypothetical protein